MDLGDDAILGSPAIPDNHSAVYVAAGSTLFALDPLDGSTLWTHALAGPVVSGAGPTIRRDYTILVGGGSRLDAVSPDGELVWSTSLAPHQVSGTAIVDTKGRIFVVAGPNLVALSPQGTPLWSVEVGNVPGAMPQQHPAIGLNGYVHVAGSNHTLTAVSPDGEVQWSYTNGQLDTDGSPAIGADGRVYQGFANRVVSLTPTGTLVWQYSNTGGDIDSCVAIMNTGFECCNPVDRILVSSNGNSGLLAINYSGSQYFQTAFQKDGSLNSSPAIDTDGDVLIGADDGKIRLLDSGGTIIWSFTADSNNVKGTAALFQGRGYIGDNSGTLYAFGN